MEGGFLFALVLVIGMGLVGYSFYATARRREAARATAASLGLQYATGDPLGLLRLPHRIFDRGDRRRMETTVHGELEGRRVALCDYVYTDVSTDAEGHTHQTDHRMSVAVLALRAPLPWLEISPEGLGRRFLNALGVGADVQFESDEFNRAFKVMSRDRDFAFTVIDAGMIDWLLQHALSALIEIDADNVVMATAPLGWERMSGLIGTLMAFEDRFSRIVWDRYGAETA